MPDVLPFFDLTSSAQLPSQIDPRVLVDIDLGSSLEPEAGFFSYASGIYIGGGILLTAAHVTHDMEVDPLNAVFPDSVFKFNFGSGLGNIPDVSMTISTADTAERLIDGRDRFQSFASHLTGTDGAIIDLSQGGPIDAGDASYLASISATPMVIFADPDDATGTQVSAFGYPGETRDGSTLCQADGEITGNGSGVITTPGPELQFFSAAVMLESGFSGGPVLASLAFEGFGANTYLMGLVSASFGAFDGLFSPISTLYHSLAESLEPFHSADDFARNMLVARQTGDGTVIGTFFNEDVAGSGFGDTVLAAGGNDLVRAGAGKDFVLGGSGSDTLFGGDGGDRLSDGAGFDLVLAEGGNDLISVSGAASENFYHGGLGRDTLSYRALSDRLTIDLAERTTTAANGRSDGLRGIENVEGGQLRDTIRGDDRDNRLDGRQGNDLMLGGQGADSFVFSTALTAATNVDRLGDFEHLVDQLILSADAFSGLGAVVGRAELQFGTAATEAEDRLIYDRATGRLYFDADGTGDQAQVLFAQFAAGTILTLADFAMG